MLVIYPVETLYALADERADEAARDVFNLLLALVDAHFHVEVLSSGLASSSRVTSSPRRSETRRSQAKPGRGSKAEQGRLENDTNWYDAIIYPHPQVISRKMLPLLQESSGDVIYVFGTPEKTEYNEAVSLGADHVASDSADVKTWLESRNLPYGIEAPSSSWVSLSFVRSGADCDAGSGASRLFLRGDG